MKLMHEGVCGIVTVNPQVLLPAGLSQFQMAVVAFAEIPKSASRQDSERTFHY